MMRAPSLFLCYSLAAAVFAGPAQAQVLLIPDSAGDKVWAFDPYDGTLLADDYIPADGRLIQPINIVDSGKGTLLISDENADAVFEYERTGEFKRVVADAADGLDALQGLTVFEGAAYVGSRTARSIFQIDLLSGAVSPWAVDVGTPRDILFRDHDVFITNSDSEASGGENIERYDLQGTFVETFHDSDGVVGIDFPQQLQAAADGGILAAGFSTPRGLYSYDASGMQIAARTNLITSPRGIIRLGNGQILYAGGTRVMRYDPTTETEETIINQSGTSFRYIEWSVSAPPIEGDVNRDGKINFKDVVTLVFDFGPCPGPACLSDLDDSEVVDVRDLAALIRILRAR